MQNEFEHQEDLKRLSAMRLLDDNFMTKVFEKHPECAQLVLSIVMDNKDIEVVETGYHTQYLIKNLQGRDVRFDIHAIDLDTNEYDIEVQRANKGAGAHRARYNSSLMDANQKDSGEYGENLTDTYVVFITENDVLHKGHPIYKIERYVDGEQLFNDGAHIIYVNGAFKDDSTEIGKLMHDFRCTDPENMYFSQLADRARYFKKTEEGEQAMCKMMEDMRNETKIETVIQLGKLKNLTADQIVEDLIAVCKISRDAALKRLNPSMA